MSDDRFVTESEIADAKQKRQEEWERVRKPEEPAEAPEAPEDRRPLFERLREQKDRAEMEKTEEKRFKNLVRGLDDEEVTFLDMVDRVKEKEEWNKTLEERKLIQQIEQTANKESLEASAIASVSSVLAPPPIVNKSMKANKQRMLLAGAVKRKSDSSDGTEIRDQASKSDGVSSAKKQCQVVVGVRPSCTMSVGKLPGMQSYSSSSETHSDDTDSQSDEEAKQPHIQKYKQPEQKCANNKNTC